MLWDLQALLPFFILEDLYYPVITIHKHTIRKTKFFIKGCEVTNNNSPAFH